MRVVLAIGGSDSSAGAGIQADLKTFAAHGVYGTTAVTAITAQNTLGVQDVFDLPADIVRSQIDAVAGDIGVDAVKTGMLATTAIVETVAATLKRLALGHVVIDPVLDATAGRALLAPDAIQALKTLLLPLAEVVTPNAVEAGVLAGLNVSTMQDAREAARRIHSLGPGAVIIKGGHMEGAEATDLLFDGRTFREFAAARVKTQSSHGTGCTFAAALAANLALGLTLHAAIDKAKEYVTGGLQHGLALGHGRGPLDHFWKRELYFDR